MPANLILSSFINYTSRLPKILELIRNHRIHSRKYILKTNANQRILKNPDKSGRSRERVASFLYKSTLP